MQTLLASREENDATSNYVLAWLNRMGVAAAPALPRVQAELALPRRGRSIAADGELQRICRAILMRLP
ncbi:hypothetical protein AB0N06_31775 [Streptomyces sp. NPDC051020]|uniref:hypothetical protein n=1 Tax=Streptomyces sp. NPDC051020 TaxID=3155409 RepID=UPI0034327C9E